MGILNRNSKLYKAKCKEASFYPFSLILKMGGRVELIATNLDVLETWMMGLNVLARNNTKL
jgi:hypothetical protein